MKHGLFKTPRTYFDSGCHEYQTYPIEEKLLDIGYAIWYGHNIMDDIRYILKNYSYVSKYDIQQAIWRMLAYVNHIDGSKYLILSRNNTIEVDVEILTEDLMRVFRLPQGDRKKAYIAESPRTIGFGELDAMNGWKKALEQERRPYEMYSFGNWIMFPGDGEIIRNFNLSERGASQGIYYPSYLYPEPWYGGPTRAKVIVLGNETRYDDFISRIQNLDLRHRPQIAEDIQLRVDSWINLTGFYFYESCPRLSSDEPWMRYSSMDLYNSPTYRYWLTELRRLAHMLDIKTNYDFYSKIAVINANPYPGNGAEPLAAGMLPSHYFLRQLVRFITNNNPDVLFILPSESLRPVWRTILGDVYTDLVAFRRMIVINKGKSIGLTYNLTRKNGIEIRNRLI